jgi:hypothetical protein
MFLSFLDHPFKIPETLSQNRNIIDTGANFPLLQLLLIISEN